MATDGNATDSDTARERVGEMLRAAIGEPKEEALEDATRRLMLQLSIEPPPVPARALAKTPPKPRLLGRLLRKPRRKPA